MPWTLAQTWKDHAESLKIELASVVQRIAQFEPVRLLTSPNQMSDARARFGGGNVEIVEAPVDDIWMRDIAPTFACRGSEVLAIDWNFNGWGSAAIITACFGDHERDAAAKEALQQAFPNRQIVMLRIDHIAHEGGGNHCLTQPMPVS